MYQKPQCEVLEYPMETALLENSPHGPAGGAGGNGGYNDFPDDF